LVLAALRTFSMTTSPAIVECQEICSQLISVIPAQTVSTIVKGAKFRDILKALESGDRVSRNAAARSFGVLAAQTWLREPSTRHVIDQMSSQLGSSNTSSKQDVFKTCGAVLGLTHTLCRLAVRDGTILEFPTEDLHRAVASILVGSKDDALLDAAYQALGYLSIWSIYGTVMRFPVAVSTDQKSEVGPETIVRELSSRAKAGNDLAILALGKFSTWFDEEGDKNLLEKT
jgi:hypothetical protein